MKFDFIVGNPPYQEEIDNNGRKQPIYNLFMDEVFKLGKKVELITPARFLFNAGQTKSSWNKKMLNDNHFKVLHYEKDASNIFSNVEIKGGVAITFRNTDKILEPIKIFIPYDLQKKIIKKINNKEKDNPRLNTIIAPSGHYHFSEKLFEEFPKINQLTGKGTGKKITSRLLSKMPEIFIDSNINTNNEYYKILGRSNSKRVTKQIKKSYIEENNFISKYNLLVPKANKKGDYGETFSKFEISNPNELTTDTFLSIGCFNIIQEAQNLESYLKTKFLRALLGIKKVTQDNPPSVWDLIPLQDFSSNSDIDWTKSISEIDQQLYKKYDLSEEEINFIETHVKEME